MGSSGRPLALFRYPSPLLLQDPWTDAGGVISGPLCPLFSLRGPSELTSPVSGASLARCCHAQVAVREHWGVLRLVP